MCTSCARRPACRSTPWVAADGLIRCLRRAGSILGRLLPAQALAFRLVARLYLPPAVRLRARQCRSRAGHVSCTLIYPRQRRVEPVFVRHQLDRAPDAVDRAWVIAGALVVERLQELLQRVLLFNARKPSPVSAFARVFEPM